MLGDVASIGIVPVSEGVYWHADSEIRRSCVPVIDLVPEPAEDVSDQIRDW